LPFWHLHFEKLKYAEGQNFKKITRKPFLAEKDSEAFILKKITRKPFFG